MRYHLYRRPKRTGVYWMDVRVTDCRYREKLGTSEEGTRDRREANELMQQRIAELKKKAPDPLKRAKTYGNLGVKAAMESYIADRASQVSPRMVAFWKERTVALDHHFKGLKLKNFNPDHITQYQNVRLDQGKAPKTINGEVGVLRQLLKHAKLWYRFDDYKALRNTKPPVGRALTKEELSRLFEVAQTRSDWLYAYTAAVLGAFCGMRATEIRHVQWKDVDLHTGLLDIRHSKTPAGWRTPTLNSICREALVALRAKAITANIAGPNHYLIPSQKQGKIDGSQPAGSWRSAWRSIRRTAARNDEDELIYPGLQNLRFHDLRHYAVTVMAEKGLPDQTIMAQVGHVSPQMMKTYSHIRRQALNAAAAALEPDFLKQPQPAMAEMIN